MKPVEYQQLAERTEANPVAAAIEIREIRLIHAALGLCSEAGELSDSLKKTLYYGQDLDVENLKEELGDCLWYIALACNALGFDMGDVMAENIAKLMQRYPEKFSEEKALEENRDREAEQNAAKGLEPCNFDEAVENVIKQGEKESREQLEVMAKLLKSSTIFCG